MQEIKIPEGCKASIDFEKRVVVIEQDKPKFNNGDIVYSNFCTLIYRGTNENGGILTDIFLINKYHMLRQKKVIKNGCGLTMDFRLATSYEQLLLFDALAKEGKKWNPDTLQIEDIEKDILVPESIGIYKDYTIFNKRYGDGLFIGFNKDKQALGVDVVDGVYVVDSTGILEQTDKVQCKLIPCKREDLKVGDTAVIYQSCITNPNLDVVNRYYKVLPDNKYAKVNAESVLVVTIEGRYLFYKVEPINK